MPTAKPFNLLSEALAAEWSLILFVKFQVFSNQRSADLQCEADFTGCESFLLQLHHAGECLDVPLNTSEAMTGVIGYLVIGFSLQPAAHNLRFVGLATTDPFQVAPGWQVDALLLQDRAISLDGSHRHLQRVSQVFLAVPMVLLYLVGVAVAFFFDPERRAARDAKKAGGAVAKRD